MTGGYTGKFLEVDLSREKVKETTFSDDVLEDYLGGRGLAAKILVDRLAADWPKVDPLGPENIFMALTGPMTGIYPGSRICCTGKSPMSNGMVGSTASSEFPNQLKTAGYDGVIVTGKATDPVYILVTDDGGEVLGAEHLWGSLGEENWTMAGARVNLHWTRRREHGQERRCHDKAVPCSWLRWIR